MNKETKPGRLVTARRLCERYGVVPRTIDRWLVAGLLPEPMRINTIRYWHLDEIERLDQERTGAPADSSI